ncbi:YheC/YheD family protein [Anoxybacillus flavithermus]
MQYGTFGEIGIDFAIDKQGKLWFSQLPPLN